MNVGVATREAARLFHDGTLALSEIEANGIKVDVSYLESESKKVVKEIDDLKAALVNDKEVYPTWSKIYGHKTNLGSREQLGDIVFDRLGHKRRASLAKKDRDNEFGVRREPKFNEAAFGDVSLPFVKDYFRWQKLEKLKNTYLDGISREVVDGRIHPFYHLHKVVTYRGSSSEINFQNIPNRNYEIARRIRRCFVPDRGCDLIEIDYSTAEVRSACCYTKDPVLISYIVNPKNDMHGDTARDMFGFSEEDVTGSAAIEKAFKKGPRDWAKNRVVFPMFFGSVHFQCAPHVWEMVEKGIEVPKGGMTIREHLRRQGITALGDCDPGEPTRPGTFVHRMKDVEHSFWNERFKVYTSWKNGWFNRYLRDGWFRTLSGFVISGLLARNDVLNYGIQGFAFHWLLWSVIRIMKRLKKERMKAMLVGQIHDCHLGSVPTRERDDYIGISKEVMTEEILRHWPSIIVPLNIEVELCPDGTSWADKKVAHYRNGGWDVS